ncbi:MAG: hypothetical protein HYX51_07290 [Chloroflexi bacterium]|nr:hypothetical protein [Chloroflexota bacterium]
MSASTGSRIGKIGSVLLDLPNRRIAGFRLRHGGLLDRRWRIAAMADVAAFTDDAIIVPDALALREDGCTEGRIFAPADGPRALDRSGSLLGRVVDGQVEPDTGRLTALLVQPDGGREGGSESASWVPICRVGTLGLGEQTGLDGSAGA